MITIEGLEQAIGGALSLSKGQKIDTERAEVKTLGLNHLSWHRGFTVDGQDVWPQVIQAYIVANMQTRISKDPQQAHLHT